MMFRRFDWPWALLVATTLVAIFLVAMCKASRAHGPAQWIEDGRYTNSAGQLCCGERDCFELPDNAVTVTPNGYRVQLWKTVEGGGQVASLDEVVPFNEATPSPDGKFWRCQWGGTRKCFFAPPPNT